MKVKKKPSQRIIAALLALFILLTMGQSGLIGVFAAESDFAVTVLDENSEKVKGATLTVISAVDADSKTVIDEKTSFSDENDDGVIEITEIAKYLETNDTTISLSYYVSAENYQDSQTSYINIDKENVQEGTTVSLEHNPTVSLLVTGYENAPIKAFLLADKEDTVGTEIDLTDEETDYVPVGSYVKFEIPNIDYYNITKISAKNGEEDAVAFSSLGNTYIYEVTDDFTLSIEYSPVIVNIEVEYDSEKGTVKYNGTDAESGEVVSVNKNDTETVFTITPKEHYVLSNIKLNDVDQTLPLKEEDGTYKFIIINATLDSSTTNKFNFAFELDKYEISYSIDSNKGGSISASIENNSLVQAKTTVNFTFVPERDYKLIALQVNGKYVELDSINYANGQYSFSYTVLSDTAVKVFFDKVDTATFENVNINPIFTVTGNDKYFFADPNNSQNNDLLYYVKDGSSVTLTLNYDEIIKTVPEMNSNLQIDAIFNNDSEYKGNRESYSINSKDAVNGEIVLNSLQIMEFTNSFSQRVKKTYLLPGSLTFKFDNTAPVISDIESKDFTNELETVNFNVSDKLSGVASVVATRSYVNEDGNKTKTENVDVFGNNGNYYIEYIPVDSYTGTVTYTVTATDNVDNVSTKSFTVKNDTQAPVLDDSNAEEKPINFNNNEGNFFRRILNAISFGKWGKEETTIDFSVIDEGAGFGNDCSCVKVMFVPDGKPVESDGNIIKTSKVGYSSVSISADDFSSTNGTFKGTIYYKLTDNLGNVSDEWQMITSANSNIMLGEEGEDINIVMIENIAPVINDAIIKPLDSVIINDQLGVVSGDVDFIIDFSDADTKEDVDDNSGLYFCKVTDLVSGKPVNYKNSINNNAINGLLNYAYDTASDEIIVSTTNLIPNDDGLFKFMVSVTDNAGNVTNKEFSIYQDLTTPVITNFEFDVDDYQDGKGNVFNAVEVTDYGFYFKQDVTVSVTAEDIKSKNEINSGLNNIDVYLVDIEKGKISPENFSFDLKNGTATFTINSDFKGQIYARATDNVGNTPVTDNDKIHLPLGYSNSDEQADHYYPFNDEGYTHPSGTVVESNDKHSETSSISIVAPQAVGTQNTAYSYSYNSNDQAVVDNELSYPDSTVKVPLYNSNPTFNVTVSDSYSGIRNVKWTIIEDGASRSDSFDVPNVLEANTTQIKGWNITETDENLVTQMTGSITVDGNHNDMVVVVELTDRAGNISYDYYVFGIDKTAPSIVVSYDNNTADTASGNGIAYFDANRTATIVISERNFNSENVVVNVTRDGKTYPVTLSWHDEAGTSSNGDDTRHITSITYDSDGDYTFSVSYTDRAQNKNSAVDYGNSVSPTSFTVDKTAPVISVSYNNNNALNGKYFKTSRTATIVITEHNFDVNRVIFTRTASLSGNNINLPSINWSNNGDVHTATINYNADGDYTFNIAMDDMAGNVNSGVDYGSSVAANDFTVDQRIDSVGISFSNNENGTVTDLRSFNDIVRAIINVNDVNYDNVNVTLTRQTRNSTDEEIESLLAIPNGNGTFTSDNFPDEIENDGIYHLTVVLTDKAGNSNTAEETFTVNRYGSVYVFNDVLNNAISNTYNQSLSGNVVITEYNASPISEEIIQVTRDSAPVTLDANVNSNTGDSIGTSGWYENVYTIPQSVFAADGIYNIYISSEDGSNNTPEMTKENIYNSQNELAGKDASFIIDATKPQIVNVYSDDIELSGDQVIANAETLTINYEISDNIAIDTITIYKGAKDTDPEIIRMDEVISGKSENGKSDNYSSYSGSITVENGFNEDEIIFKIVDKAGNVINTSSEAPENEKYDLGEFTFLNNVTVDTNPLVLWYANKPLFWGSIGALAAIIIGTFLIIFFKKRKKNNDEEHA